SAVSDQVVQTERERPAIGAGGLREDRLFEREERSHFSSPDGHVPDDAREHRSPPVRRDEQQGSRDEIGESEEDERSPPANPVRDEADGARVECAAEHGQGQDDSDREGAESELGQVDAVADSEKTVAHGAYGRVQEDEFAVSIS